MRIPCILAFCALPALAQTTATRPVLGGLWQEQNSGSGTAKLRSVVESDGTLIAVGDAGAYLTSTDKGASWTTHTTLNIGGTDTTPTTSFYDIQELGDRLVLVGSPKIILVSDDGGATWTNTLPTGLVGNFGLRGVISLADDGDLVAVGTGGAVLESLDNGDTWDQIHPGNVHDYMAVASDGTITVAVGFGGAIMARGATASPTTGTGTGTDTGTGTGTGTTTTDTTTPDPEAWVVETSGTTNDLYGVTYTGSTFVAVGMNGVILTSTDGVNWTSHAQAQIDGVYPFFTDVISVSGLLMTSGTSWSGFRYSTDEGATWNLSKVTAFGGANVVAGGSMQDLAVTSTGIFSVGLKAETWFSDGSFELWASNAGLTGTSAAETADPDGDGLTNLTEFVLGLDPNVKATPEQRAVLPVLSSSSTGATAIFTLPATLPAGVTATIERSTTLTSTGWTTFATRTGSADWVLKTAVTPSPITSVTTGGSAKVTVALGTGSGFFRLKFSRVSPSDTTSGS